MSGEAAHTVTGSTVLIVGLGNPGEKYQGTRHNLGFHVVEKLGGLLGGAAWKERKQARVARTRHVGRTVLLAMPQTYMNESGRAVQELLAYFKISPADCLVVVDDLDLKPGKIRQRFGGSDGGHRGLRSIIGMLGTGKFMRMRIGIGRPPTDGNVISHVLGRGKEDEALLTEAEDLAARRCLEFIESGVFENWSSP